MKAKKILAWMVAVPVLMVCSPLLIGLGVLYVTISTITWGLDVAFGDDLAEWGI